MDAKLALEVLSGNFLNVVLEENESHADAFAEAFNMAVDALEKLDKIERIVQFEIGDRHDIERMVLEVIRGEA